VLEDLSDKRTAALIEGAAKSGAPAGSNERKIADLYHSFMDEAAIQSKGMTPFRPHLEAIAAIRDKRELAHALGEALRADVDPLNNTNYHTPNLFGIWVAQDFANPDRYTAYLLQGGIELPDRQYYLDPSESMRNLREKYVAHITAMLKLAGFSDPEVRAKGIFDLEHAIAEKHWSLADNQDIHKADNPWTKEDFSAKAPGLDWNEFFQAAVLDHQANFIVWQPSAFTGESALVASMPLETWKDWLAYHFLEEDFVAYNHEEDYGSILPKAFAEEHFAFFGKVLVGTPQQEPRERRAIALVNHILGDAVGKLYAERYFPPAAKARAQAMVANIVAAFRKRLQAIDWMAPATKAEAITKLDALYIGIGYPERWRDYSGLEIHPDDIFGNLWRASLFQYHRQLSRLGRPVDRHEWAMTPQTVNAVNLPLQDALNFPAAILEPPFFDPHAPDASNYGAIGAIIGHEVSHTFDSEGSTFDAKGTLRNWWTPADLAHFNAATAKLAAQFDSYRPFPDLHVNGRQTLAEDIADLGGLAAALDGYHAAQHGKEAPDQDGFTGDQQFFIAFGQVYEAKWREAALRRRVLSNEHAPPEYRVDTVRNLDPWYAAFHVHSGEQLYLAPAERVRIW
jgi:endothelin-converting enzyme/putative endopeptidase